MQIIYSDQPLPTSIEQTLFLAGPSIRDHKMIDWRRDAISYLESKKWQGIVFIPIPEAVFLGQSPLDGGSYDNQIKWERQARKMSDIILFWVDRSLDDNRLGLTTNFELGQDLNTGRVLYGRPDNSDKVRYTDRAVLEYNIKPFNDLNTMIDRAIEILEPIPRQGGAVNVPANIYRHPSFQNWLFNLQTSGNRLDGADVISVFPHDPKNIFFFMLKVDVFIAAEMRHKTNEFITGRINTTTVIPYYRDEDRTLVVMVMEFRSASLAPEGIVIEFPSGANEGKFDCDNAVKELFEETGLSIKSSRLEACGSNQLASTIMTTTSSLYKVELTKEEMDMAWKHALTGRVFGEKGSSERTRVLVCDVRDVLTSGADFSTIGMLAMAGLSA